MNQSRRSRRSHFPVRGYNRLFSAMISSLLWIWASLQRYEAIITYVL
jgi:hypothetical protein